MSRTCQTLDAYPCPEDCRKYHDRDWVTALLHISRSQFYRIRVHRSHKGTVRCDRLRAYVERDSTHLDETRRDSN